ncbi:protein of unknown function [Pseudodesulfovibrio piezophilus C1TLV30]|uniref:Uncharacterized protein n=1 Tax=Pseudodesulfovibrio piezophilus (strain DSM 21447 / JCM 15486 / C1TLV30) TaxID=1322246 RepID=M1WNV0_PSEP2|nr:protein of unknown function [Pseudodesulfovibrio piezophilus C1TLV30]
MDSEVDGYRVATGCHTAPPFMLIQVGMAASMLL